MAALIWDPPWVGWARTKDGKWHTLATGNLHELVMKSLTKLLSDEPDTRYWLPVTIVVLRRGEQPYGPTKIRPTEPAAFCGDVY